MTPYTTVIRLLGVVQNPVNGFPARPLGLNNPEPSTATQSEASSSAELVNPTNCLHHSYSTATTAFTNAITKLVDQIAASLLQSQYSPTSCPQLHRERM